MYSVTALRGEKMPPNDGGFKKKVKQELAAERLPMAPVAPVMAHKDERDYFDSNAAAKDEVK
jgi:hypothetical protein